MILRTALIILLSGSLTGCWLAPHIPPDALVDADGDGDPASADCDDSDPLRHSGAVEVCDAVDNDCDGLIDERLRVVWFLDGDGDGFGDPTSRTQSCSIPGGTVPIGGDCDDGDAETWPGAPEWCDGVDRNCDGAVVDEGGPWFEDRDGDGYGSPLVSSVDCTPPTGFVAAGDDCDDEDPLTFPGAVERCDGLDRNCDGAPSEAVGPWHVDGDGDGYGDPDGSVFACAPPAGHVADGTDCNDGDSAVSPGAPEQCNGFDDNCDPSDDLIVGDDPTCAVTDCEVLQTARPTAPDGVYWIDPAGTGPLEAWCDLSREGGGWTLVYAYTFTAYATFTSGPNAVTPAPSWSVLVGVSEPVSTTAPLGETDYNAMDHGLWAAIGDELFVVSNINDWLVCQELGGGLTGPSQGAISCANVLDVAPACSGLAPHYVYPYNHGWGLFGPTSLFLYWDGSTDTGNYPTHDPCGTNGNNQLQGVASPRGAIYIR